MAANGEQSDAWESVWQGDVNAFVRGLRNLRHHFDRGLAWVELHGGSHTGESYAVDFPGVRVLCFWRGGWSLVYDVAKDCPPRDLPGDVIKQKIVEGLQDSTTAAGDLSMRVYPFNLF